MPEITYTYLPEGAPFDAASLNDRFQTVVDGMNGIVEFGTARGTFGPQHLNPTGVLAVDEFPTVTKNCTLVTSYSATYVTWGGNGVYPGAGDTDREVIDDGTADGELSLSFNNPVKLGMNEPDKIAGLLVLLNAHLFRMTAIDDQQEITTRPAMGAMVCIQFTNDGANWFTVRKTERIQWNRTMLGETGNAMNVTAAGAMTADDETDFYICQDIGLRTLILPEDLPFINTSIRGIRAAVAVWDTNSLYVSGPLTNVWLRECNFTVIPLHAGVI